MRVSVSEQAYRLVEGRYLFIGGDLRVAQVKKACVGTYADAFR
jgi:hypothetical protein